MPEKSVMITERVKYKLVKDNVIKIDDNMKKHKDKKKQESLIESAQNLTILIKDEL